MQLVGRQEGHPDVKISLSKPFGILPGVEYSLKYPGISSFGLSCEDAEDKDTIGDSLHCCLCLLA